jgi:SAM-dependent methyltransferase
MPFLYDKEKTHDEARCFVHDYVSQVKSFKHDRYHSILSLVPHAAGRVLDYGCGWGHFSIAIRDKANIVNAIDLSQNQIDICHSAWGNQRDIEFACSPITKFQNEYFDCVLSNQVIEHVHNVGNYLAEINRVLKPGGLLVISLPNVMNPRFFLPMFRGDMEGWLKRHNEKMLAGYDKGNDHINAWDPLHFTTLLSSMGFLLERYLPTEGIPLPMTRLLGGYLYLKNKRLSNLSYTMTFRFSKMKSVQVAGND